METVLMFQNVTSLSPKEVLDMLSLLGYKSFMIHIVQTFIALIIKKKKTHKASLSGGFMAQVLTLIF
jgi:hypothetical protein